MWTFGILVTAIGFIGALLAKDPFNDRVGVLLIALLGGKERVYRLSRWFMVVGIISASLGAVSLLMS